MALYLDANEAYNTRCGEVFLTNMGSMVFHCTICDNKYKGFEGFADHIRDLHLFEIIGLEQAEDNFDNCDEETLDNENDVACMESSNHQEEIIEAEHVDFEIVEEIEELNEEQFSELVEDQYAEIIVDDDATDIQNDITKGDVSQNVSPNDNLPEETKTKQIVKERITGHGINIIKRNQILDIDLSDGIRKVLKKDKRNSEEECKHECPICGATFKERNNMHYHLRRHSNVKNFECPECDKRFYTSTEVRVHMRTHTGSRPFLCSECGLTFQTNTHLEMHLKKHRNQRDFHCTECERSFFTRSKLKEHLRYHRNERPYVCSVCSAGFVSEKFLNRHKKTHENKREYKCQFCPARFNQSTGLRIHEKNVHKHLSNKNTELNKFSN